MKLRLWFEILDALAFTRGYGQLSQSLGKVHHIQQLSPKPTNLHGTQLFIGNLVAGIHA